MNEYKRKTKNENTTNEYRYFLESNFVRINKLIVLVFSNKHDNAKRVKTQRHCLPKGIMKNYNVNISGKNFYTQAIDFDIKRYEGIRNLTRTRQGQNYTTRCLSNCDDIKGHYILTAVDLGRHKELDVDPKAIQQI